MLPKQIGRYAVESEIGSGGQAIVYKCRDSKTGEIVAVKALRAQGQTDAARLKRFHREIEIASGIHNQNVVRILEQGTDDDLHYAVMEYVPGSLSELMEQSGALEPMRALEIAADCARGLAAAHAHGIVHRDVKPQNILVDAHGRAKLTDFGVARALDAATMTRTGAVVGTPYYMSPEQVDGQRADIRSDIYSLGCVLFEMLAGQVPFDGDTPLAVMRSHMETPPPNIHTLNADVNPDVTTLLNRCLAKAPADRLETPEALATELEELTGAHAASEIMRPGASAAVTLEGEVLASEVAPERKPKFGGMIPAMTVASLSAVLTVLIISAFGIVDWRFWEDSQPLGYSSVTGPSTPQNPPVFIYSPNVVDSPEVVRVSLATSAPTGAAELVITSLGDKSPVSTAPPLVSTLEFIEIALSGIEQSQVDGAEIEFGIDAARRAAAGDRGAVVAYRYVDDWVPLPTTFIRAEGTTEIYSAITPGFSFFAISVSDSTSGEVIVEPSPTTESELPVKANPTATATPDPTVESIITPTASEVSGDPPPPEPTPVPAPQVPGPPTITDVTVGDRFAIVTWLAPGSDGGAEVTGYRIVAEPGSVSRTADADQRSITLAALESDVAYTFAVSAINSVGTGEAATRSGNAQAGNPPEHSTPVVPIAVSSLQPMAQARDGSSATLLADGRLLVLGGTTPDGQYLNTGEVFDPQTGEWSAIAPMAEARGNHTATLIHDARVFVAGGVGPDGLLAEVEVYDTFRDRWESDALMAQARSHHTATLLADGGVLIVGGYSMLGAGQAFAEVWDQEGEYLSPISTMGSARARHTATLLTDGTVLVIGGTFANDIAVDSAEIFDPGAQEWVQVEAPGIARYDHAATRMLDGRVIVVGGVDSNGSALSSA